MDKLTRLPVRSFSFKKQEYSRIAEIILYIRLGTLIDRSRHKLGDGRPNLLLGLSR